MIVQFGSLQNHHDQLPKVLFSRIEFSLYRFCFPLRAFLPLRLALSVLYSFCFSFRRCSYQLINHVSISCSTFFHHSFVSWFFIGNCRHVIITSSADIVSKLHFFSISFSHRQNSSGVSSTFCSAGKPVKY